jgi:hypothetical protein
MFDDDLRRRWLRIAAVERLLLLDVLLGEPVEAAARIVRRQRVLDRPTKAIHPRREELHHQHAAEDDDCFLTGAMLIKRYRTPRGNNKPEYTEPEQLQRLRGRGLSLKRSLAWREFVLGIESLERFVRREPLRGVHECVFGVLALESEPVDPRL